MPGQQTAFHGPVLAAAMTLAATTIPAMAEGASVPDFTPDASSGWFSYAREFMAPLSGPGPVRQDPSHPFVSNDEFRLTGKQPTFAMGDPDSPILKPWARDVLRRRNQTILSGKPVFSMHASCWPYGVTEFLLQPMTRPMYILQAPREVLMILSSFNDVRHIQLTDRHSRNPRPSWYGESIGHYEGDTLVVDTIGFNDRTVIDQYDTPHTDRLHVVERWHLIDDGNILEVAVHVEDPGAFAMPWNAIERYRRHEETVTKANAASLAVLATPEEGPLQEAICAENPHSFLGLPAFPIPEARGPDF